MCLNNFTALNKMDCPHKIDDLRTICLFVETSQRFIARKSG